MGSAEKRRFKRLNTRWITRIATHVSYPHQVRNVSLGGVFLETSAEFQNGQEIELEMRIPDYAEAVRVRGVVRWVEEGHGVGVEFLELGRVGREVIHGIVRAGASKEYLAYLTRTKLHSMLLRFYCRKVGETFPQEVLAQFLGCTAEELVSILKDFALYRMVRFSGNKVTLAAVEDAEVARGIRAWYESLDHGSTPRAVRWTS
jgi:Tfp pilus assembly protein PilZ